MSRNGWDRVVPSRISITRPARCVTNSRCGSPGGAVTWTGELNDPTWLSVTACAGAARPRKKRAAVIARFTCLFYARVGGFESSLGELTGRCGPSRAQLLEL